MLLPAGRKPLKGVPKLPVVGPKPLFCGAKPLPANIGLPGMPLLATGSNPPTKGLLAGTKLFATGGKLAARGSEGGGRAGVLTDVVAE